MKNANTISKATYLGDTVLVGLSLLWFYRRVCFSGIYCITVFQSKIVFWAISLVFIFLGTYITYKERRNYLSLAVNLALPIETYTLLSTIRYIPVAYKVVLSAVLILSVIYFSLIVFKKVKHKKHKKRIILNRIKFASLGVRTIAAVLLLTVTLPVCLKSAFGYELMSSSVETKVEDLNSEEWSLIKNMDTVVMLKADTWNALSMKEKLDVLGVIKNIELKHFGINHEVYLDCGPIDDAYGCYCDEDHRITINAEHLKSSPPEDVLRTLLHECMHVYQRRCVDLYNQTDDEYKNMLIFYNTVKYKENFADYNNGDDNIEKYYEQIVESSARDYAAMRVPFYFESIDNYLQQ